MMTALLEPPVEIDEERPDEPPPARRSKRRRRRLGRKVALVFALLLSPVAYSYGRALTYPGSAGWTVRSIDWLREHHGGGLVNRVEVWYFTRHHPPTTGRPKAPYPAAPTASEAAQAASAARRGWAPTLRPAVRSRLPGEGRWVALAAPGSARPGAYATWFQPDPKHPTLVAGAVVVDPAAGRSALVAGTREPTGGPWRGSAQIPSTDRSRLLVAFNSGFKTRDSHGGFFQDGRPGRALKDGLASLTVDRQGRLDVVAWHHGARPPAGVTTVRQNLELIVQHGRPVSGLVTNADLKWGSRKSQLEYVWRSGIGIDAKGRAVYVAGDHFTLDTLAHALVQAGAVRAMELDIHMNMVTGNLFGRPGQTDLGARKLLPNMPRPATRYLQPDQRDFVYVVER